MKVEGPDRFTITIHAGGSPPFEIKDANGAPKFSGRATSKLPKLYVVTAGALPIYVGITKQSMRTRLRLGWSATGESGYHGYRWRHHHDEATLDLWYHVDSEPTGSVLDIETVEAELVYLIRHHGQWPEFQTEIHFHASREEHRATAAKVWSHYRPRD
jgi:hypothetical protein